MRKQMKINKETDELLKYYKQAYYDKEGYNASYTFIVNKSIEELSPDISLIDWGLVKIQNLIKLLKMTKKIQFM